MTFYDLEEGKGNWVILDLPIPLGPVLIDIERPIEEQLPQGIYLEAARKMISNSLKPA